MGNGLNMQASACQQNNACLASGDQLEVKPKTVHEFWQDRIESCKQQLEYAIVQQAKATVAGLADHPVNELRKLTDHYPF